MSTQGNFKNIQALLSHRIVQEYEKLIKAITVLPENEFFIKKFHGTGGLVSAVDLIAYQIG